ncbi:hypothetical protein AMS68_001454 [Peltaster fructicola]|uniref:Uncharacterized protein n=1 Tax=Peltaster fructicola TaxID=286661 RepID=A0A6H0XMG1_9PEZI|nr:hypothetical protein AMS68_001454 [Peltaster fructicola]
MSSIASPSPALVLVVIAGVGWFLHSLWAHQALKQSRKAFKEQHGCKDPPPNMRPWDIFGFYGVYLLVNEAKQYRLLEYWNNNYKIYGQTHSGNRRGRQFTTTMDVENFKAIHATNFDDWAVEDSRQGFIQFLGKGVFLSDGAFWAHSRSVLRPQFEKHQVAELGQFEPHVQRMFKSFPTDGSTIDLQVLFHKLTMDTSSEFLIGRSTLLLDQTYNEEGHEFAAAFEAATQDGTLRARLGWMYWLWPHFAIQKDHAIIHRFAEKWVQQAMQEKHSQHDEKSNGKKSNYTFLKQLVMDDRMDAKRIHGEILNIMLAGRDTTASLLSAMFFVLSREARIMQKLRAEVDELNGELPTYERLRDMKYLKYCAQEALRLYPPVPSLVKSAARDTVLPRGGGPDRRSPLFMAKGDLVFYNHYSMMRSTEVYGPDATVFRPERWEDSSLRPGWAYLPFGGGARICLGQQYALTEAYYVTIRMLQEYRTIECRDDQPWKEKLTVTLCSLNGTKVALYK